MVHLNNLLFVVSNLWLIAFTQAQVFNNCNEVATLITCSMSNQNQFPTRNTLGTISTVYSLVSISSQNFSTIPTDGRFGGLSINSLIFNSNGITSLTDNIFTNATSIVSVAFRESSLATISSNAFEPIKSSMTTLSLVQSEITVTRMNTLKDGIQILTSLQTLQLDTNSLITVSSGWLTGLTGLTSLSLKSNQIAGIDSGAFTTNTRLATLDLSSNQIVDLSALLTSLTPIAGSLATLTLTGNKITSVPDFPALSALRTLTLTDNQITSLSSDNTFLNVPLITSIVLTNNSLTSVPKIPGQGVLLSLDMSNQNSQLTTLAANSFYREGTPTSGVNINLDLNTIGTFDVKAFCTGQGPYYTQVSVSFDSIGNFNKCSFKQMKNDNSGLRTTFVLVEKTGVTDYTSFCNCDNKVFATNNQVDLAGACSTFNDTCTSTTYVDNCSADYTCPRTTSASTMVRFEYLGFIITNLVFLITFKQF